jgi:serine/threonine protein kinase
VPPTPESRPERLGDYDILAPIDEGGMASVFVGRATAHPERLVALKVIRPQYERNKEFVAMFLDEARVASRLAHPNIVAIAGVGYDGKRHFIAMELMRGHSLLDLGKAAHARGRRLPYEVVAWIGARIADALHCAHELVDERGALLHLVHRDVNPVNVFITREGIPKLIDFGLAKARDRIASTAMGVVKGKLAYLAPEQVRGQSADRRTDVFALGVTLWETSLDRRLFLDENDVETIRRVRETQVPDPMSLDEAYPLALADAVTRALARDPTDRWPTAAKLRDALDAFVASVGFPVGASNVRALMAELFAGDPPLAWEHLVDEASADKAKTIVWEGPALPPPSMPPRPRSVDPPVVQAPSSPMSPRPPAAARSVTGLRVDPRAKMLAIATGCGVLGALAVGLAVRGCRGGDRVAGLDQRVARIEALLGLEDAGAAPVNVASADVASTAEDRSGPCALAKVAGFQAWQEALAKAKVNATGAEVACASIWNEKRKQACYYVAMSGIRAIQAARDAVITGGDTAREAIRSVKDDPKNDALVHARAAGQTALSVCEGDGGSVN